MKKVLLILVCLSVIFLNVSISAAPITITYGRWAGSQEAVEFQKLVDAFMKENPGIKVKTEFLPWGAYWNKLQTTILSGQAYDVISFSHLMSSYYVSKRALYDMTDLPGAKALLEKMQPGTKPPVLFDGKIYGMPVGVGVRAMIYNKDMFDEAGIPYPSNTEPMTWDEFMKIAPKLTKVDEKGEVIQYAAHFHKVEIWEAFVAQAGGKFVDDYSKPTKILINTPAGIAGLQFLRDLVEKKIIPPYEETWEGAFGSPDSAVATGKVAIMQCGPWALPAIEQKGIRYGTAPLFMNKKRASRGYVNFLSISRNCKHPQAAWKFIKWIADEGQLEFVKTGDLPANTEYLEASKKIQQYPEEVMAAFYSELPFVITGPLVPTNDLVTITDTVISDLTSLMISAEEAASRIEEEGNEVLATLFLE